MDSVRSSYDIRKNGAHINAASELRALISWLAYYILLLPWNKNQWGWSLQNCESPQTESRSAERIDPCPFEIDDGVRIKHETTRNSDINHNENAETTASLLKK